MLLLQITYLWAVSLGLVYPRPFSNMIVLMSTFRCNCGVGVVGCWQKISIVADQRVKKGANKISIWFEPRPSVGQAGILPQSNTIFWNLSGKQQFINVM